MSSSIALQSGSDSLLVGGEYIERRYVLGVLPLWLLNRSSPSYLGACNEGVQVVFTTAFCSSHSARLVVFVLSPWSIGDAR